ncbi:PD-(D/E)XK nuclease family protein (plasmid) [Paenibacillus rhizovicinus]|uniref:PD-(D/E)XK nuclease family protein n=1 Tax=Paenibacillus rhizovicinus TaxID=2704463 RepID=A0A6C0PBQ6_9BACL|nr:PD-(D/E)XK nuclease family protein [Paenibacillus rhizovicinus]QHW35841.1 PD-(D/E)XK nuclease family protein [Paenibacillus rhizovicinus]
MEITIDQLYDFKSCGLKFKLTHVDRVPNMQMSENDGLREAVLMTISYFYMKLKEDKMLSMESMKQKFTSLWYGGKVLNIKFDSSQSQRKRELDAFGMLASFHRKQRYVPDEVVSVNTEFRIPFGPDLFITGKIPLIRNTTRGMEIVNFKTSNHKQDEFWNRTDMALTLQAIGFHSMFNREADSMCLEYLKLGTNAYVERRRKDYQRLYKQVRLFKEHMEKGYYYPRESYACDKCPAKNYCMEWS